MKAYLKSPADVAVAIGVKASGAAPMNNDPMFIAMLDACAARIENLLGTGLEWAGHIDKFKLRARFPGNCTIFRLAAGFVDPDSLVVTDPYGNVVNSDDCMLRADLGSVMLERTVTGTYTFQYNAGFKQDASAPPLYLNTPEWLRSIADSAATYWLRTARSEVKTPEHISHHSLVASTLRYLASSVYGRYDRPRSPALFPDQEQVVAPFDGA